MEGEKGSADAKGVLTGLEGCGSMEVPFVRRGAIPNGAAGAAVPMPQDPVPARPRRRPVLVPAAEQNQQPGNGPGPPIDLAVRPPTLAAIAARGQALPQHDALANLQQRRGPAGPRVGFAAPVLPYRGAVAPSGDGSVLGEDPGKSVSARSGSLVGEVRMGVDGLDGEEEAEDFQDLDLYSNHSTVVGRGFAFEPPLGGPMELEEGEV